MTDARPGVSRPSDFDAGAHQQQVTRSLSYRQPTPSIAFVSPFSFFSLFSLFSLPLFPRVLLFHSTRVTRVTRDDRDEFTGLKNGRRLRVEIGSRNDNVFLPSTINRQFAVVGYECRAHGVRTAPYARRMHCRRREVINGVVCESVAFSG